MRRRYKIGVGCLGLVLILVGVNAYSWFNREPRPIVIAEAGESGERITINGFPANFYRGKGQGPRPAILLLGGSEGGLREYRNILARQLASEGYSVLYQAYYATSNETRSFNMVPLETLEAALDWLVMDSDVRSDAIAVMGHSKGAEASLLLASRDSRVSAVVAAMPSDVVWQGFDFESIDMSQFSSSFSEAEEPLPYLPYATLPWHEYFTAENPRLEMFKQSRDQANEHPSAFIRIEHIAGPILMICGEDDTLWPGCRMGHAIARRSLMNAGPTTQVLAYDNAGHWAFGPADDIHESDARFLGRMGGSAEGDIAARRKQWPLILEFLDTALANASSSKTTGSGG